MKYIVRPNPRAYNPVTGKVDAQRIWEVAQVSWSGGTGHDSEEVVWHCAAVKVNGRPIIEVPEKGLEFQGICTRDQDNAISIREGRTDVS